MVLRRPLFWKQKNGFNISSDAKNCMLIYVCHEGQSRVPSSSTKHNCISCFSFAKIANIWYFPVSFQFKDKIVDSAIFLYEPVWATRLTSATWITSSKAPGPNMGRCKQLPWPEYGSLTQDLKIHCDVYPQPQFQLDNTSITRGMQGKTDGMLTSVYRILTIL